MRFESGSQLELCRCAAETGAERGVVSGFSPVLSALQNSKFQIKL